MRHSVAAKMLLALLAAVSAKPPQCGEPGAGPVLGGIDLVEASALAGQNASVPRGSEMHGVNAFGYRFLFVSEANAAAFQSDPAAHVPRFGGYCGIAMTGHDDCCLPLPACLGPTCIHLDKRYAALPMPSIFRLCGKLLHFLTHSPHCPCSYGVYAGSLVFFFSPGVKLFWDHTADANLIAANANWAALIKHRNITVSGGVAHCFNTDFLWCLHPGPIPPPPFPQCGTNSSRVRLPP
jgi:hypothetical protein